ncbi:ROK family protein [Jonesia quinghaiensis]|uniref:ROK family protein n=1 Tax=Jonesia quinghaiensis TaxID=262806 RepID=UPI0004269752|nr:ROK family protein [Jonesia quinghaiensis]
MIDTAYSRPSRWDSALSLLRYLRTHEAETTRTDIMSELGLSSSTMTDICARLRDLAMITEESIHSPRRGRPSLMVRPHPHGPVVGVIDVSHTHWRFALAQVDGTTHIQQVEHIPDRRSDFIQRLIDTLHHTGERYGDRLISVVVSVRSTVSANYRAHPVFLGWEDLDFSALADHMPHIKIRVENNASLSALAECHHVRGAGYGGAGVLLIELTTSLGGAFVSRGTVLDGATGSGSEFGHMPFGRPGAACRCGAVSCWATVADGYALARLLGDDDPTDPESYIHDVFDECLTDPGKLHSLVHDHDAHVTAFTAPAGHYAPREGTYASASGQRQGLGDAVQSIARGLGQGVAGLANALAPDVIVLGGQAITARRIASTTFHDTLTTGLMQIRRESPPRIVNAQFGAEGYLRGGALLAFDDALTPRLMDRWCHRYEQSRQPAFTARGVPHGSRHH